MGDAKAGLKRALGIANNLEKEKFRIVRQWLRNDEESSWGASDRIFTP